MIPAIPSGYSDPNPLVTQADYTMVTEDSTLSSEQWDYFLPDTLDQLQRKMQRTFLYGQYTERLYLYRNGQVYPSATPFDVAQPVMSPAVAEPPENVGIFQGNGIWVGWFIPLPSLPVWSGVVPPQTDITYWGGWSGPASSGPGGAGGPTPGTSGPLLPAALKRIVCKVIWYMAHPATLAELPGGTKSSSVGGVTISGDLSMMVTSDRQLARDIRRWTKPQAHAWDGQATT